MAKLIGKIIKDAFIRHAGWWKDYMTEISVVVIGLCITYCGDHLLSEHSAEREEREAVGMVRDELLRNLAEIQEMNGFYVQEIAFSSAFSRALSGGMSAVVEDSVARFDRQHRLFYYWMIYDNAFRMLCISPLMQRIDKNLQMDLFGCYAELETVRNLGENYRARRFEEIMDYSARRDGSEDGMSVTRQWALIQTCPGFARYLSRVMPVMARGCIAVNDRGIRAVGYAVAKIDSLYPPAGR